MKLTPRQQGILTREYWEGYDFVCLYDRYEDRIAKALSNKGLGDFTSFKSHYSWRPRSGYINHFTPNLAGIGLRSKLLAERDAKRQQHEGSE